LSYRASGESCLKTFSSTPNLSAALVNGSASAD
jgi:hypothetical protein